jgi:hypothetical protein
MGNAGINSAKKFYQLAASRYAKRQWRGWFLLSTSPPWPDFPTAGQPKLEVEFADAGGCEFVFVVFAWPS